MPLNYNKVAALPSLIRGFCHSHDGWIVGSGALYLLDLKSEFPRDWDVLIPLWTWGIACKTIPEGTPTNSHGGIKIKEGELSVDVWAGDIGWFLAQVPSHPAYAVHPKSLTFICSSKELTRIKS